ncbi:ROK family protein [Candidatus Parcubacteria bacterium]|jgi:glucokinase|nr:ROK family protein [Candidatus Parcubacteria bacterium]
MRKAFIGFDVGGTNIEGALISKEYTVLSLKSHPTQNNLGKKQVAKNVIKVAEELLGNNKLSGIGLGWPTTRANIKLSGKEIKNILEKKFKVPVFFNNDADVFALSEAIIGQGKKYSIVVALTLGTGVGCGVVVDKKIYHGRGGASEFGHVSLNFNGPKCVCGNTGCFEEYAGSRALKRLGKKYKLNTGDGLALYNLAKQGNKKALRLWQEFGQQLGLGIISIIHAYDPEIIILGGQISKAWKFFHQSMEKEIKNKILFKPIPIKVSKLQKPNIIGTKLLQK